MSINNVTNEFINFLSRSGILKDNISIETSKYNKKIASELKPEPKFQTVYSIFWSEISNFECIVKKGLRTINGHSLTIYQNFEYSIFMIAIIFKGHTTTVGKTTRNLWRSWGFQVGGGFSGRRR
jgi:riboflavin synthase alpha subunit